MYKARCRRSREDTRGPKKNREIHLRLHLSYFLYDSPPAGTEYPFIFTGQDLSPNKTIASSVYLIALHPAVTESMTALSGTCYSYYVLYLGSMRCRVNGKTNRWEGFRKYENGHDVRWMTANWIISTRVRYVRLVFPTYVWVLIVSKISCEYLRRFHNTYTHMRTRTRYTHTYTLYTYIRKIYI